jgi:hypothetical protein
MSTLADWQTRGGTVQASVQLPPMDLNKEHVFELLEVRVEEGVTTKFGVKTKVKMVWKESGKETEFHRIWISFNESYSEKSNLVAFLTKVSPNPPAMGKDIKLGDHLAIGMRIRAMVKARIDPATGQPNGFYDFVSASIKRFNAIDTQPQTSTASLLNARLLTKRAKDRTEALDMLAKANAPKEVVLAFFNADLTNEIVYPVK